jgi:5-(carboxyamino)imidazole ribonucleotide mutase
MKSQSKPLVGIIMGSDSDWPTLKAATDICKQFLVPHEVHVVSAHRTPDEMAKYAKNAYKKGLKVIIAGAGGAAHLPGMVASQTPLPVIGVPIRTEALSGMDSLLSIVQMPGGVPVATVAIGAGKNAGLLAVEILATSNAKLMDKLIEYKKVLVVESRKKDVSLNKEIKLSLK